MINYIYDSSFEGLLTALYEAFRNREYPNAISPEHTYQESLFFKNIHITTNTEDAQKVYNAIKSRLSHTSLEYVFYVYLSELDNAGMMIYNYLKLGWKIGKQIDLCQSDDAVLKVHKTSRKVAGENHRMMGLLRFRQIDADLYYAPMEPDHNIITLLASHFADRLSDQNWIIHDIKRKLAAAYNKTEWALTGADFTVSPSSSDGELNYQHLWKQYFKNIAISNRISPNLQRKNMPARYWKHMVEK